MFYYTAFSFNIASEIEFPELFTNENPTVIDLNIQLGSSPRTLEQGITSNPDLWITPDKYLIHFKDVAWYYAENGNCIIADIYENADEKSIRLLLLCNAMAAIIHQRKLIPLHTSGVITKNGVALILGHSGAGKSTTIKALTQKGHKIFTDDVCVLQSQDGKVTATPSYPMMKLWENSFSVLNMGEKNENDRLRPGMDKYGVFFHSEFNAGWQKVIKIFNLVKDENIDKVKIEKQKSLDAFIIIGENTYRNHYVDPMKLNALHFNMVSDLLKQCDVYKITRPADAHSISEVIEIIEKELQ